MIWGFDTETDNDGHSAWIVQWVLYGCEKVYRGTDTRTLRHILDKLGRGKQRNYIYIHNLKYDLQFLLPVLYDMQKDGAEIEPIFRQRNPIQVAVKTKYGHVVVFRDSLKKWQGDLRSLGDAIGCPKLENTDPDFHPGWSRALDLDSEEDWRYVTRDAEIVCRAGIFWHANDAKKATSSGDAWHKLKKTFGNLVFNERYPPLTRELDDRFRKGYFGGINLSFNQGMNEGPITHEDKVSMYPGVMMHKPLPRGNPIYMGGLKPDEGCGLWIGTQ